MGCASWHAAYRDSCHIAGLAEDSLALAEVVRHTCTAPLGVVKVGLMTLSANIACVEHQNDVDLGRGAVVSVVHGECVEVSVLVSCLGRPGDEVVTDAGEAWGRWA